MHVWKVGTPSAALLQISSKATTVACCKSNGQLLAGRDDSSIIYLQLCARCGVSGTDWGACGAVQDVLPFVAKAIAPKKTAKKGDKIKRQRSSTGEGDSVGSRMSDTLSSGTAVRARYATTALLLLRCYYDACTTLLFDSAVTGTDAACVQWRCNTERSGHNGATVLNGWVQWRCKQRRRRSIRTRRRSSGCGPG
eukprot:879521-Rhodomonas_salina.6